MKDGKSGFGSLKLFHLPWQIFLIITVVVMLATYLGVLPQGMTGCFIYMIVVGDILAWIGDHTPIIKSYLGGTGDVAVLSAADRMELMPFAQISSRLGGAIILLLASLMLSILAKYLVVADPAAAEAVARAVSSIPLA